MGLAAAAAQATDLVSTGVSELLSSLSEDVNIGLRYLPSTTGSVIDPNAAQTEDLFEMDLGLNLLNDRLKISGTLGARSPDGLQVDPENFTRAIDLRYQLTADGRWELMGYSKPESDLEQPTTPTGTASGRCTRFGMTTCGICFAKARRHSTPARRGRINLPS